jgi:ATP-binding cassette subfamily B protein
MAKIKKRNNKEKIDFKHNLKLYWKIAKPYKWFFVVTILVIMFINLARIVEKFILKELIDKGTEFSSGTLALNAFMSFLFILLGIFIVGLIVRVIGHWFQIHLINRMDGSIMHDIKRKFFNHIVHLDHNFHTTHKTGSLISRLTRGSRAVEATTDFFLFNGAPLVLQFVIVGSSILYFDALSALMLVLTGVTFIGYSLYIVNKQQKVNLIAIEAEDREKGNISDVFTNIDSIKYFGKEDRIKNRFGKLIRDTKKKSIRGWDYYRWLEGGQSLILGIGLFFLIYFPLNRFLAGDITIGTLAFIYTAFFSFAEPLFGFVWGIRRFYEAMADFQYLFEYDKIKNSIVDKPDAPNLKIKKGEIEFKNIWFAYKKRKVIDNVNIKIKPGEKIALVGHSGSGKTTLIKLLYRFYDVNTGEIKIDGRNIKNFKQESLREELSIVPQGAILFDDTIYNNIAFSNPSASREEVMRAIKFAQLDNFIEGLPKKDRTIVGERGVKLSGGEKQRVSIARAILADKKVLVLDEATSSLDSKTEFDIQRDLEKLMEGRTSIIIAHRLSTIMRADKIIVMDKGKIAQLGKHRDLINKRGVYKELWNLQKGGYIKE